MATKNELKMEDGSSEADIFVNDDINPLRIKILRAYKDKLGIKRVTSVNEKKLQCFLMMENWFSTTYTSHRRRTPGFSLLFVIIQLRKLKFPVKTFLMRKEPEERDYVIERKIGFYI